MQADPIRALRVDVVIVGARCAGAATAMLLARRGLDVLVVDRHSYGSDTLSTHALMRSGVTQLYRWGLLDTVRAAGTPAVKVTSFRYPDETIDVPIKLSGGVDALYAPRRTVLDRILVDAARRAGAEVRFGYAMIDLLRSADGRVRGIVARDRDGETIEVRADIVIGADGLRSSVAKLVDAPIYRRGQHSAAVLYSYWSGIPAGGYRWHYGTAATAGAIPTNDGETCVFVSAPTSRFFEEMRNDVPASFRRILASVSPELAQALGPARQASHVRGFAGVKGQFRQSFGPGWALVGDAGYFKDPATAHGITDALRDAELLADAVTAGSEEALARYQDERDAMSSDLFEVTDRIAAHDWSMDELKRLHRALNDAMRAEAAAMATRFAPAATPTVAAAAG